MIYEKISTFAIVDNNGKVIQNATFTNNDNINLVVSALHLFQTVSYKFIFLIADEKNKLIQTTGIELKPDNNTDTEIYNISTNISFKAKGLMSNGDFIITCLLIDKKDEGVDTPESTGIPAKSFAQVIFSIGGESYVKH